MGALGALAYGLRGVQQWRGLEERSWDLAIFSQVARDYSELRAPIVPIKGDSFNLLGDHFHPILVVLGPVWAVWPSPLSLLWVQAVLMGISAVPLTRLAIDRLGAGAGLLAGAAYLFGFGLQAAADVQFHEIAFALPLLAFSLTALLRGRFVAAIAWAAPLVLVKEDMGLTVAVLGAVIALRSPLARRGGMGLAAWGLGWFVLSTFVVLPALNPGGQYDYGGNLGSPLDVFVPVEKWTTVLMLLLAAGVIGARSPIMAAMLPTLAWRFAGNVEFYWGWYWHYNAVLMPIALAALLDALGDRHSDERRPRPLVRWTAVVASAAVTLVLWSALPLANLGRATSWEPSPRAEAAAAAVDAVPGDVVVASDITVMARLVPHDDVQWVHGTNARVPDCVLIDREAFSWGGQDPGDAASWASGNYGTTFDEVMTENGFEVACRPGTT
ncbi:hypothetical protein DEO23_03375 [Brachybacterium endophyticum]|uniref:DUF2079 domain-containing protein n=2 Tax=Brachybacterium endophyticum TaxID=2182385 RepID=A0A2U2RQ50_9MICO|nr:hypothetical protein DEO23_03375 [Brachybacterium endophyticum]